MTAQVVLKDASGAVIGDRAVSWASLDAGIATIDAGGVITAVQLGDARIVASAEARADTATLTVIPVPVATVLVTPAVDTLVPGDSLQLSAAALDSSGAPAAGNPLVWSTTNADVATVTPTGRILAVAGGRVDVRASAGGRTGIATITVLVRLTQAAAGPNFACALDSDGRAYCWGRNDLGQLGNGTTVDTDAPVPVTGGLRFTQLVAAGNSGIRAHACGLTPSGDAYCWGANLNGELGDGTTTDRHAPAKVVGNHVFQSLSAGFVNTCGFTSGGALYCWGQNNGVFGTGGTSSTSASPVLAAGGMLFQSATSGDLMTCGIGANGEAWCWGLGTYGQLGNGGTANSVSPDSVRGGLTFVEISTNGYTTCGRIASGALYCWGFGTNGEIGDGATSHRNTPTLVAGTSVFTDLSRPNPTCGLRTDGLVYCWGSQPLASPSSVPVPAPGGRVASSMTRSNAGYGCLVAAGPTLLCWGGDTNGRLGNGPAGDSALPTPVLYQP